MKQNEREALIHKYHTLAAAMQKDIDSKFDSGVSKQRPTARRARIAESMRRDGERMIKVQTGLRALASYLSKHESLSDMLVHLTSRKAVEDCLMGFHNEAAQTALKALIDEYKDPAATEAEEKRAAEAEERQMTSELIGAKIPGFWPTPKPVVMMMMERVREHFADDQLFIKNRMLTMLEPSAGIGDIARVACDYISNEMNAVCHLTMMEYNIQLWNILKKRHEQVMFADSTNILMGDFLLNKESDIGKHSIILMNPPFEKGADMDHVRHAYDHCLADGGILVAIMGEGAFFREDAKARDFRDWLEFFGGESTKLPEDAFAAGKFRSTSVSTRLVVMTNN